MRLLAKPLQWPCARLRRARGSKTGFLCFLPGPQLCAMDRRQRHHRPAVPLTSATGAVGVIRREYRRQGTGVLPMKKSARVLAFAGLLTAFASAPAFATWVPVTGVPLDSRATIDVVDASRELPTRVDALSFTARDTDVVCRDVTGFFR